MQSGKYNKTKSLFEDVDNKRKSRKLTNTEIDEQFKPITAIIYKINDCLERLNNTHLRDELRSLFKHYKLDYINLLNLADLTNEHFNNAEHDIDALYKRLDNASIDDNDLGIIMELSDATAAFKQLAVGLNFRAHHAEEDFISAENPGFSLDAELDNIDTLLNTGRPALADIQALLQDNEIRQQLFETNARRFKKTIYKKSIENMARALIAESRELFCALNTNELYTGKFSAADFNDGVIPTLYPIMQHRNKLNYDVAKNIMGSNDIHQAAFAIDYWINVAYECAFNPEQKDLHSAGAINTALRISSVYNLFEMLQKQDLVNPQTLRKYETLASIISHQNNYAAPKQYLVDYPDAIPSIDYQLTIMTLNKDANNSHAFTNMQPTINQLIKHQQAVAAKPFGTATEPVNIPHKMPALNDEVENKIKDELQKRYVGYKEFIREANENEKAYEQRQSLASTKQQLTKVAIISKKTLVQNSGANAQPIAIERPYVKFNILTDDENLKRALNEFNLLGDDSLPGINLIEAVENVCEYKIKSPSLLEASPLIQYIAFNYYLQNTKEPNKHAAEWVAILEPKLLEKDPERFKIFWGTYRNPEKLLDKSDETLNEFVMVSGDARPFPGMNLQENKNTGANPAGPYGGLYVDVTNDKKKAMIKRDSIVSGEKSDPRFDKIISECVAGNISGAVLGEMHKQDDKDYEQKYSAKVTLVKADVKPKENETEDHLIYLRSDIINNKGDLWEFAFIKVEADAIYAKNPGKNVQDAYEKYEAAFAEGKKTVREIYHGQRPSAAIKAFFGFFNAPIIKVPCDLLLSDPALLTQFCEMSASRMLVGDMGLHSGNFVVLFDEKTKQLRLGSFDFGAAFDEYTPTVLPFKYKDAFFEQYKNHIRDYDPKVIFCKNMALALIKVSQVSDEFILASVDKTVTEQVIPYTIGPIKEFCARMGVAKSKYENINDKAALLDLVRSELKSSLLSRKASMMKAGFGLLLENCFIEKQNGERIADIQQLQIYLNQYPELGAFIDNELANYQPVKPEKPDLLLIINARKDLQRSALQHTKLQKNLNTLLISSSDLRGRFNLHLKELNQHRNGTEAKLAELYKQYQQLIKALSSLEAMIKGISAHDLQTAEDKSNHKQIMQDYGDITRSIAKIEETYARANQRLERRMQRQTMIVKPYAPENKPAAVSGDASVLTIAMLGTNEHRDNGNTILTQFCHAVKTGPNQSVYLLDGPGGEPKKANYLNPRVGTYIASDCVRDPVTGVISVKKTLKTENIPGRLRGVLQGAGGEDAIAEALLVVDTMLETSKKPLILNLTGFSRGADNILRLANELAARYSREELIVNMFALDPVAGPLRSDATRARLIPSIVSDYESVIVADESRQSFETQDMRQLTVQDTNQTKQAFHIYTGVHSACNYFMENPNKSDSPTTKLAWDDLARFANRNGVALNQAEFHYVQYGKPAKANAIALTDDNRLDEITKMLSGEKGSLLKYKREFTNHIYDYCLHHGGYFLDHQHMLLFKTAYPYLFDRLFQRGLEFPDDARTEKEISEEMRNILDNKPLLAASLERLNSKNDKDMIDFASGKIPPKRGIYLIANDFYRPDNALHILWKGVQAILHPILNEFDKSCHVDQTKGIYDKIRSILEGKGDEKIKIQGIAGCLIELKHDTRSALFRSKVNGLLNQAGIKFTAEANMPDLAENCIHYLDTFMADNPKLHVFYKNVIIRKLKSAFTQLQDHQLGNDPALINELLTTACKAITLEMDTGINLGPEKLIKGLRIMMLGTPTISPAAAYSDQQKATIDNIMNGFRLHLIDDTPATVVMPADIVVPDPVKSTTPPARQSAELKETLPSMKAVKQTESDNITRLFGEVKGLFVTMRNDLDDIIEREQKRLVQMKRELNISDVSETMFHSKAGRGQHTRASEAVNRTHQLKRLGKIRPE